MGLSAVNSRSRKSEYGEGVAGKGVRVGVEGAGKGSGDGVRAGRREGERKREHGKGKEERCKSNCG